MPLTLLALVVAADAGTPIATFPDARSAFAAVLERKPEILAVGEYHEIEGAPKVRSAVQRFTTEMLPLLKGRAKALVLETWITNGKCGEVEKKAVESADEAKTALEKASLDKGVLLQVQSPQGGTRYVVVKALETK